LTCIDNAFLVQIRICKIANDCEKFEAIYKGPCNAEFFKNGTSSEKTSTSTSTACEVVRVTCKVYSKTSATDIYLCDSEFELLKIEEAFRNESNLLCFIDSSAPAKYSPLRPFYS